MKLSFTMFYTSDISTPYDISKMISTWCSYDIDYIYIYTSIMCIYIYTYIHIDIFTYIHIYIYIYIYIERERDSHDIHIIPSWPCRATVIRDRFRSGTAPASPWRIEWREGSSRRIVPGMPRGSKGTDGNDEIAGKSLGFRSQKLPKGWSILDGTGTIAIFWN